MWVRLVRSGPAAAGAIWTGMFALRPKVTTGFPPSQAKRLAGARRATPIEAQSTVGNTVSIVAASVACDENGY